MTEKTKKIKKEVRKKPEPIKRNIHEMDATGKILGRLATEVAILLRGKNKANFQPHIDQGEHVIVNNASKIKVTGKKLDQKIYYHFSGYPGGLKKKKMGEVFSKNPADLLKRAVWNMLPKNKLRNNMIKRLKIMN